MSYSGIAKAVSLSVALSACAHAAPTQTATSGVAPAPVESAGTRDTDGPRFKRLHSAFLAGEARPNQTTGGEVFVEHRNCDVWASEASARCDIEALVNESIAPGTASTRW